MPGKIIRKKLRNRMLKVLKVENPGGRILF